MLVLVSGGNSIAASTHQNPPQKTHQEEIADIELGSKNALVTIIEYSSINCSHCALFHTRAFQEIEKNFIHTNKVHYVIKHFPLDYHAVECMAVICQQPQSQWYALVKKAYENIGAWIHGDAEDLAKILGVKYVPLALENDPLADKIMAKRYNAEKILDIEATPVYILIKRDKSGHEIQREHIINVSITDQDLLARIAKFVG